MVTAKLYTVVSLHQFDFQDNAAGVNAFLAVSTKCVTFVDQNTQVLLCIYFYSWNIRFIFDKCMLITIAQTVISNYSVGAWYIS